ncbi:MAG: regulatory iron-sulfur-containing complex subunit RicT [Capsulimonadales bacterium]|nr:regulatory iron-sulfur-containing complex subunit RicT [Capsulimonadales bacterium]
MTALAGVTFQKLGKLHYYPAEELPLAVGTHVVAETERGDEFGQVKILRDVEGERNDAAKSYRILRVATPRDVRNVEARKQQADDGANLCQERAHALRLPMKIVEGEVSFDGHQITLYFVAETRVDFRQLVKEVAARLKMRVHLHQVGSRDHARALGGYGPCGRPLCCTTFLREFAPVSMKMAKDQSLYLNPSKFSGVCGKLMCCLRYEHDIYVEAKARLPQVDMTVALPTGERGVVVEVDVLRERLTVVVRDEETTRYLNVPAAEAQVARACGDCGSAGGGCGSDTCGSGGCGVPAKIPAKTIQLQRWHRNWNA